MKADERVRLNGNAITGRRRKSYRTAAEFYDKVFSHFHAEEGYDYDDLPASPSCHRLLALFKRRYQPNGEDELRKQFNRFRHSLHVSASTLQKIEAGRISSQDRPAKVLTHTRQIAENIAAGLGVELKKIILSKSVSKSPAPQASRISPAVPSVSQARDARPVAAGLEFETSGEGPLRVSLAYQAEALRSPEPFNVPKLPEHYIERSLEAGSLTNLLLGPDGPKPLGVALCSMGGLGKTALATAVVLSPAVRDHFTGGVYWIHLGPEPNVELRLADLCRALDPTIRFTVEDELSRQLELRRLLRGRNCLVVLDNVWNKAHADAFNVLDRCGALLLTTRTRSIATALRAEVFSLPAFTLETSASLLARLVRGHPGASLSGAAEVASNCAGHPLALRLCAAMVRDGVAGWSEIAGELAKGRLDLIEHAGEEPDLDSCLALSFDRLNEEERACFADLGILFESSRIPEAVLTTLWRGKHGFSALQCRQLIHRLADRSLLDATGRAPDRTIVVHDLIRHFARGRSGDLRKLHEQLIDVWWKDRFTVSPQAADRAYGHRHLPEHLLESGNTDTLRALLLDFDWIDAKVRMCGVDAVLQDFRLIREDGVSLALFEALRFSAHVVSAHPEQLCSQLIALLKDRTEPELVHLVSQARAWSGGPWIQLVSPDFRPFSQALERTLLIHRPLSVRLDFVNPWAYQERLLAIRPDQSRALVLAEDQSVNRDELRPMARLEWWDIEEGRLLREIEFQSERVRAGGQLAGSDSLLILGADRGLLSLDLATGDLEPAGLPEAASILRMVVSEDGSTALFQSRNSGWHLWKLGTMARIEPLDALGEVLEVALSGDGSRGLVAVGTRIYTFVVADKSTPRPLAEYDQAPTGLHLNLDGSLGCYFVENPTESGKHDGEVHLWDLKAGAKLLGVHLERRPHGLFIDRSSGILIGYDERFLLLLWSLSDGQVLSEIPVHIGSPAGLHLARNKDRLLTLGHERQIKTWTWSRLRQTEGVRWSGRATQIRVLENQKVCFVRHEGVRIARVPLDGGDPDLVIRPDRGFHSFDVSSDGRFIVTGEIDGHVRLRLGADGRVIAEYLHHYHPNDPVVQFTDDDGSILVVYSSGSHLLLHCDGNRLSDRAFPYAAVDYFHAAALLPGGTHYATWAGRLHIRSLATGKVVFGCVPDEIHGHNAFALEASADNRFIVGAFYAETIFVCDLVQLTRLLEHPSVSTAKFPENSQVRLEFLIGELATSTEPPSMRELKTGAGQVFCLCISPDSKWVAAGFIDGSLRVWELETGRLLAAFQGEWPYESCQFGGDSRTLYAGNGLGQVVTFQLRGFPHSPEGPPHFHHHDWKRFAELAEVED